MNLLSEISHLPRSSKLTLLAELLKEVRPSVGELAHATCVTRKAVYDWMGARINKPYKVRNKSTKEQVL